MTEYEQKIISTLKDIGFNVKRSSNEDIEGMHDVRNATDELIGYAIVSDGFCTIGTEHYSITFDTVLDKKGDYGAKLFRSGIYAGSINL